MSENLDLVRSIFASWERGDFEVRRVGGPRHSLVMADGPMPGSWTGLVQTWPWLCATCSCWTHGRTYRVEADDFQELADSGSSSFLHARGRGKTSRLELEQTTGAGRGANLFHVRNGSVRRLVVYFDSDRALADLGLAE